MPITEQERITLAVNLADALAAYVLADKTDKHGKPLIEHSRRVAAAVKHLSHEQHIAALLHDVVEDSTVQWSVIESLFGFTVGTIVGILTRRELEYNRYIEFVSLFPHARAIKLADLNDNLDATRGPIDPSLKARYEKAKQLLVDVEKGNLPPSARGNQE